MSMIKTAIPERKGLMGALAPCWLFKNLLTIRYIKNEASRTLAGLLFMQLLIENLFKISTF